MNTTLDLFGNSALLSWLPDETLFSLASRHHCYWGHRLARHTNLLLFGRPLGGNQHDLPSCIDEFAIRTEQQFGTATTICAEHTLLRYYCSFMDDNETENAIATLRSTTVSNLKFRLGLLTSRFRAHHPLKACRACMANDRETWGWAYWHLQHQYPGVWVCPSHGLPLQESDLKASGVERFLWHLPDEAHLRPWPTDSHALHHASLDFYSRLASLTVNIVHRQSRSRIDLSQLHWVYRAELGRRNLLTPRGGFRLSDIANEFTDHVQTLRLLPEFAALPATADDAYTQLSRYLRVPRSGTHPLRHMIMIEWLFGDAETFFRRYAETLSASQPCSIPESTPRSSFAHPIEQDHRKLKLLKLIQEDEKSMRAAAAEIGIDVATAIVWAAQQGVTASRRPKKLKPAYRQELVAQLRQGLDKAVAAKSFQISVVTVTHVLRSEVGLHRQWQCARHQTAQQANRGSWSSLVTEHGELGVKFIRNLNPGAYAWLYRNDRAWLAEHSPTRSLVNSQHKPSVRWDQRDLDLSAAVERAALALRSTLGKRKLMLWHLYQEVHELKAKLSVLARLPLTQRAIEVALKRPIPAKAKIDIFG